MFGIVRQIVSSQCRLASTSTKSTSVAVQSAVQSTKHERPLKNGQVRLTKDGGERYLGFTYYPRFPGQDDPPYSPSKVLMVQRIRTLKRKPYWDKEILIKMGLGDKKSDLAFVPNTPNVCALLWQVKHLVRITPVTLPEGLPEDGDFTGARLQENGELRFVPKLKSLAKVAEIQGPPVQEKESYLDTDTVRNRLRHQWMNPW